MVMISTTTALILRGDAEHKVNLASTHSPSTSTRLPAAFQLAAATTSKPREECDCHVTSHRSKVTCSQLSGLGLAPECSSLPYSAGRAGNLRRRKNDRVGFLFAIALGHVNYRRSPRRATTLEGQTMRSRRSMGLNRAANCVTDES